MGLPNALALARRRTQSYLRRNSGNGALLRCASTATTLTALPVSAPTAANVSVMPLQVARATHDVRSVQSAQDHSVSSKVAKANRRRRTHIVVISQMDAVGSSI